MKNIKSYSLIFSMILCFATSCSVWAQMDDRLIQLERERFEFERAMAERELQLRAAALADAQQARRDAAFRDSMYRIGNQINQMSHQINESYRRNTPQHGYGTINTPNGYSTYQWTTY